MRGKPYQKQEKGCLLHEVTMQEVHEKMDEKQ